MTTSRVRRAPLLLGAALAAGALVGTAAPALATSSTTDGTLCLDYDTLEEAQAAVDSGEVDTANLDRDGDGVACEEEELPREGVVCPPEEVSDLFGLLPGECDVEAGDPDLREEREMPVGGVDAGSGGTSDAGGTLLLASGAGLVAVGTGALVRVRRRRA